MKEIINPYGFIYITTNMINGKRYIGQRKFTQGWCGNTFINAKLRKKVILYGCSYTNG